MAPALSLRVYPRQQNQTFSYFILNDLRRLGGDKKNDR